MELMRKRLLDVQRKKRGESEMKVMERKHLALKSWWLLVVVVVVGG